MYVDIVCELSFMLGFVSKHVYIILTLKVDQNNSNLQYTINYTFWIDMDTHSLFTSFDISIYWLIKSYNFPGV